MIVDPYDPEFDPFDLGWTDPDPDPIDDDPDDEYWDAL